MEVTNELPCRELDLSLEDVLELFVDSEEPFDSEPWDFSQSLLPPSPGFFSFDEANGWEIKDRSEICPESGGCESLEATQIIASDEFLVDDGRLGVSSPVSCSGAELGSNLVATSQVETRPYCSNSSEGTSHSELNQGALDLGRSNSNLHCDSFLELKSLSPESGCTSSDEQVQGRSCNNCPTQSGDATASGEDVTGTVDEDTKKRIRLMRNRESATQSRLRKKSYVKELEMRYRMLESHCSILQQTVAFTSQENILLKEELNKIKCSNLNGSKSGVVEPAALPSDSLPSESPPCLTASAPFRLDNWELLACLYHVLLLTLLETKAQSRARRGDGERRPWVRIRRCQVLWLSPILINLVSLGRLRSQMMSVTRKLSYFSTRAKRRNLLDITHIKSQFSTCVRQHQHCAKSSKKLRKSGRHPRRWNDLVRR
ncbi:hypothetical protein Mp_3g04360 [Marchantia polymorpha subsp. ruderalis]|uniref:BZIP domain-containing protein n=2 Tax=Marchantia polymorpha TaxID=3197 RepID=A0AAF6AXC8_MARPO|nr:hypothetical protein MARPO_0022s0095 [Marchantia polymorpha]BBN04412.1 hypothetical protein Mp_3g04360 [Marchantia polymorpha subsp. ruderalis]|eukprot:PTQ43993.1 hypothetical protein MARPO_0022s0095 [Marchantia polymorpha]